MGEKPKGSAVEGITKCTAMGCKANDKRFGFCDEHYEQFKFGLITRGGKQVSDFDRKIEHYQAFQKAKGARKTA